MIIDKLKPSFFSLAAVAIITTLLVIQNHSEDTLQQENESLRVEAALLRQEVATLRRRAAVGSTGPVRRVSGTKEVAAISYNFQSMPLMQVFSIYEGLSGKKLTAAASVNPSKSVKIVTGQLLTTNEAMRVIEDALEEQAGVKFVPKDDENLLVVPVAHVSIPQKQ